MLDPPAGGWADARLEPKDSCGLEVVVDGAEYFPLLVEALRSARSHVFIASWYLTPGFELTREGGAPLTVADLLAEVSGHADVKVLVWAGAPAPPNLRTSRSDVKRIGRELRARGPIEFAADSKEHMLHCHHEKLVVIDDRLAFVGGIDMTDLAGDRYDSNEHPARPSQGWHDVTTRLTGPIVADVSGHFRLRWREVTGEDLGPAGAPEAAGSVRVQLVRTVPERIYDSLPSGDFSIMESYMRALKSARHLVYIENQFLWSPHVVDVLSEKLARPPNDDFRLIVVLPSKPNTGHDDTMGQLAQLVECDGGAGRFLGATLYARTEAPSPPRVYIHAKVGIVDDGWLTIGSANLNHHSMFNDTEVNVVVHDPDLAASTRHRLWAEHLECSLDEAGGDPTRLFDERWVPIAAEQARRREAGEPLTHRLVALPHVSKKAKRLIGPIQSLLVDG